MAIWKQITLTLLVVLTAAVLWAKFYPGAGDQLARWGVTGLPFETASKQQEGNSGREQGGGRRAPQGSVVTAPVIEETINDRLSAIGTGRAVRSVEVTPFTSGRMTQFLVNSGETVKPGDVIAKLDSDAEEIAAERAALALKDAEARLERMKLLLKSNTATTVQVTDAELTVDNAKLQLREAQLNLSRRSVESPISGVVGILPITAGNYITSQTVIATVDDRSEILIDFWVPERFASAIKVGAALTATSVARPGDVFDGVVSAIDNRIATDSRTLQVQARIQNGEDKLRAGMSFQVSMKFQGDTFPAVNPLAVQWGSDGAYVWAVRDGTAQRVLVNIIQRNTDSVLVKAELTPGEEIVTEGLHLARQGAKLNILDRQKKPESSRDQKLSSANSSS